MPDTEHKKEEAHVPEKKKGKGLLIIILAVALVGLGAGGFLVFKGKSTAQAKEGAAEEHGKAEEGHGGQGEGGKAGGSIVNLEPFIVNLQDNSGTRYLKLTINLELGPDSNSSELTAQAAQVRDSLIILLSSKSYADIGTVEGKYQMRDEIVARVNQYLTKGKVKTAYFTDFVIQ
ncbi:MAG: flagellar basal body-associated FliL family protein [Deltaproteobacteria bacterium]|nr:flagellar basal body-associated FliL family protein [Deltaproteobacteria bacterium]